MRARQDKHGRKGNMRMVCLATEEQRTSNKDG